jgi:hypothetical protein
VPRRVVKLPLRAQASASETLASPITAASEAEARTSFIEGLPFSEMAGVHVPAAPVVRQPAGALLLACFRNEGFCNVL